MKTWLATMGLGGWMLAGLGCGDDGVASDADRGSSSGGAATTMAASTTTSGASLDSTGALSISDTGASTGGDSGPGTTAGDSTGSDGGTDSTDGTTGVATDGTTTGVSDVQITLSGLTLFQDCKPIKQPDPVVATFAVDVENPTGADVTPTVVGAAFKSGAVQVATLDVSPTSFGPVPAGGMQMFAASKDAASMNPAAGCSVLMCGGVFTLEVTFEVDGAMVVAETNAMMSCVF